ncbi:IclR family transcriptional regulator [Paracoccus fistulariae]|uniref:IclR family transcriptional regulator n=1 Tax=Paracoccus fistulariae TaxID=658446 RepID=A0ABY7SFX8_9RHOB|nr:IclR family transcriptional regulator [Paracoccus fistulariae]MDB6181782.1 IclR family transcriptional regulator [Paracoccus fistulariae]WCR05925.1 IclR family transcriptional regulator [Paracoccus fistulariae]
MIAKTLANALDLLDYFTEERPAWGVRELAKKSGVHPAIVQRALNTFASRKFLVKDPESQKYAIGVRFLEYGQIFKGRMNLSQLVRPLMRELADQSGETVFLSWLSQGEAVCIEIYEAPDSIRFSIDVGTRFPLYAGANAKAIMAFLPGEERDAVIARGLTQLAPGTICDPDALQADLATVRQQGWAASVEEFRTDTFGLAVPLFAPSGEIAGSLSIAGPLFRRDENAFPALVARMQTLRPVIQNYISS